MIRESEYAAINRCMANINAWLAFVKAPPLEFVAGKADRCWFAHTPEFFDWVLRESSEEGGCLHNFFGGYRERVPRYSVEIVFQFGELIEIDFDYYNPDYGLFYTALHGFECLRNKWPWKKHKTDPYKIADGLRKRGILTES